MEMASSTKKRSSPDSVFECEGPLVKRCRIDELVSVVSDTIRRMTEADKPDDFVCEFVFEEDSEEEEEEDKPVDDTQCKNCSSHKDVVCKGYGFCECQCDYCEDKIAETRIKIDMEQEDFDESLTKEEEEEDCTPLL